MEHPLLIASRNILTSSLGVHTGETLLVVADRGKKEIAEALCEAGEQLGAEVVMMLMQERQKDGEEPPAPIREAMKQAQVVVCATEYSLTHTEARRQAAIHGARIATMPGITADMFLEGAITADYETVQKRTNLVTACLTQGREVTIKKDGRILRFSIEERTGVPSTGVYRNPGESGNLPSGEAYIAPVEGTASGEMIVDGSIAGIGKVSEPVLVTIEKGRIIGASGQEGSRLLALLGEENGRILGEFGIGTNDRARVTGNVLEDEKVYGTIHIAFGSNRTFGGMIEAGVHIDLVVHHPDVKIDGKLILSEGRLTLES